MGQIKNIKLHIVTDIKHLATARLKKIKKDGEANKEGGHRGQVRHTLRSIPEEDGEEDRSVATCQVHVQVLWEGRHETVGCRYLEVQVVQEDCCRWCVGSQYFSCCHCEKCHSTSEGDARDIIVRGIRLCCKNMT